MDSPPLHDDFPALQQRMREKGQLFFCGFSEGADYVGKDIASGAVG
jgi:hypothetical protein